MVDFSACPVVDNHAHVLEPEKRTLEPIWFAREFFHGMADIPIAGVAKSKLWGATEDLQHHFPHMGVVLTAVCQLARLFGCEASLAAVTAARNARTEAMGLAGYARMLYADAGIVCSVLDANLPPGDPLLDLTPGRKLRLLQMDPLLQRLLREEGSYGALLRRFQDAVAQAVGREDFVGIKSHLGELVGFGFPPVEADEAERIYGAAAAGDATAFKRLYMAVWMATLIQAQELRFPVHIHTGITGGLWNGPVADCDPFLLVPLLRQPRFLQTRLILLHAGYPWLGHAAMLSHTFPHVWVDIGWTTPWASQGIAAVYREVMALAPLSKVIVGSGGHGTPEVSWLAARVAKIALGEVMGEAVRLGLMAEADAARTGRMILHDNAARLYGLTG